MKLSKVDAAKTIGVSRQTLYAYIKASRISVDPDGTIDTAELLRAGFTLHQAGQSEHVEARHDITPSTVQVDTYWEMIELLRQQLADAREREQAYREQLALLGNMLQEAQKQNQRLLDMPRQVPSTVPGPQRRAPAIPETWQKILELHGSSRGSCQSYSSTESARTDDRGKTCNESNGAERGVSSE